MIIAISSAYGRNALRHVIAFFRYIWETIKAEKMPVWLTLLGIGVTAYATYIVAPFLNSKFEVQKAQSQYVMDNLKYINEETAKLFALFSELQTIEGEDAEKT